MQIAGIIAEYNPFHNGHAHHIERTRAMGATHIVAVMSGNFVQRGVPALLYKQVRTVAALENGADLVVELPLPFALSTAEHFAYGGVKLLDALGCVDVLSFGSECGEIEPLIQAAMALEDIRVQGDIRRLLSEGMTYAKAREQAVELHISGETARILREPNNILGMEYLKAIADTDSHIRPVTVARTGTGHDSDRPAAQFASASHIRRRLMKQDPREVRHWMPKKAYRILKQSWKEGMCLRDQDSFERGMLPLLRSLSPEQIAALPDLSERHGAAVSASAGIQCARHGDFEMRKTDRCPPDGDEPGCAGTPERSLPPVCPARKPQHRSLRALYWEGAAVRIRLPLQKRCDSVGIGCRSLRCLIGRRITHWF